MSPQTDPITIEVMIDSNVGIAIVKESNLKTEVLSSQSFDPKYHRSTKKEYTTTASVLVRNVRHILVNCQ
jgi:hypothetical protein